MSAPDSPADNPLLDETGCAAHEPYALRVLGDSMEPEFADGCIVIVDPAGLVRPGAYVVARVDEEPIFRQYVSEDGRHWLKPLNPGYAAVEIPDLSGIVGVVTQRAGTRRSHRRHYA